MNRKNPLPSRESWVICFILGVVMLNYPFLHIFNKATLIFGIPLIIAYLLVGWPLSIFIIYLFSLYLGHDEDHPTRDLDDTDGPL